MKNIENILIDKIITNNRKIAIGGLLGNITHEINSPLTALDINFQALKIIKRKYYESIGCVDCKEDESILRDMEDCIIKIKNILTGLRTVACRNPNCICGEIRIDYIIDTILLLFHDKLKYGITVTKECERNINIVCSNIYKIEDILLNLFLNSIESMGNRPAGELIVVVSNVDSDAVEVLISDTGRGYCEEALNAIRNRDYERIIYSSGDLGMGIYIACLLIDEIGGSIEFSNNTRGGADCRIKIPSIIQQL